VILLDEGMLDLFPWPGAGRVFFSSINPICLLVQPALFLSPASAASAGLLVGLISFWLLFFLWGATGTRFGSASAAWGANCTRLGGASTGLSATCTRFGAASTALALLGTGQTGT